MVILLASGALAGALVVHDGSMKDLRRRAELVGVPAEAEFVPVEELAARRPVLFDGAPVHDICSDPEAAARFDLAMNRGETAIRYEEFANARGYLEAARADLSCLPRPVSAQVGAKLFLFRGVVAAVEQDAVAARAEFVRTYAFEPSFAWDPTLPSAGEAPFSAAVGDVFSKKPSRLYVRPDHHEQLWIDGAQPPLRPGGFFELPAGLHLVQFGDSPVSTFEVDLASGERHLTVPALAAPNLSLASTLEQQRPLRERLQALVEPETALWVAADGAIWETADPWRDRWKEHVSRKQRRGGTLVAIAGGALAVAGGGVVAAAARSGTQAVEALGAPQPGRTRAEFEALEGQLQRAGTQQWIGVAGVGTGAALATTGLVVTGRAKLQSRSLRVASTGGER